MLKQFMEQLSSDFGSEQPLAPNEEGFYSLSLEPNLDITIKEGVGSVVAMKAILAPLPEEKLSEFLQHVMTANLLGRETGGSTLGLDKEGKKLVLLNFFQGSSTYREFHDSLEDFVNYAESWRQEITDFGKES